MIYFFTEDHSFKISKKARLKSWLKAIAKNHDHKIGDLNYVFCSDEYLHNMNVEYLNHDTLTDIITFDQKEGNVINGDIFISVDRVSDNAKQLKVEFESELLRVLSHGILHIIGYKDKTPAEAALMREQEEKSLILHQEYP
ncbi:MAG: rRNA maturation RNase YbeY [Flavobacteriales bacterium]